MMANYVDYEEKLSQLEARKIKLENKLKRAQKDAFDEACYFAGKMVLQCFDNDPESIRWDKFEIICEKMHETTHDETLRKTWTIQNNGKTPGKNLAEYLGRN